MENNIIKWESKDKKYTVIFNEKTGEFKALRYGEPWRDLVGDNLILNMFFELVNYE